jgi:hypothetical protein
MQTWIRTGFLAALLALPGAASALTISDPDKGGEYTLSIAPIDSDTYVATFTIDFSTVPLDIPATSLNQIEFKVANSYVQPISVTSAPDATGNWLSGAGPLEGKGCGGSNGGFICLSATTPLQLDSATLFEWEIQFDAASLLPESDWHIGARYTSPTHTRGWVVSLSSGSDPIPEPASGLLFAAGLLVVGASARRRIPA